MNFIKKFLSSPASLLLIPIIIIMFIVVSNSSLILERMGFETRTHLKSELTKAKYTIATLQENLDSLKTHYESSVKQCKIKEDIINNYIDDNDSVDNYIKDLLNKNQVKEEPQEQIREVDVDVGSVNIEVNENIVALHDAYNTFFGG